MAEAAITAIAKSALQLLSHLAKHEFLLLWKSGTELKRLKDTIETISCYDTDKLQSQDQSVQKCLSRLRDAMYDVEEFFDALHWRLLHKKTMTGRVHILSEEVRVFFSKSNQLGFIFKTAHRVKSLRESLDSIKDDMELCHFIRKNPLVASDQQVVICHDRARTHSFVSEKNVIGRDQDRDRIINMLLPPQDQGETSFVDRGFSIVAVIGFGGLGKTTVAQLVYNDERVKSGQGFEVCLWACINYFSNLEQVLIEIIASKEGRLCDLGLEKLQQKLREIIGGRKFLVVIDDVWDEDFTHWASLETILDCGKFGSKVLVTTRSQKVAKCLCVPESCCVNLEVLSNENAWSLFVKKAFLEGELIKYPELESIGREIVHKCANVPLLIVVIGSLIGQETKDKKIWSNFVDNELGKSLMHSDDDNIQKNIKNTLMVSYNNLLPNLKLCFASCSLFPKDRVFYKDALIHLWLSQGFLMHPENEERLEELGEKYFFQLVERCFFQEVKQIACMGYLDNTYSPSNNLYEHTAKMHDLLHDMAIDVAKTESICLRNVPVNKCQRISCRHISVGHADADSFDHYCSLTSDPKRVKTLLLNTTPKSLDLLLGRFKMLRTLKLSHLGITSISDHIGELIHLRYLDLSGNYKLKHLPYSICNLHHLMILALKGCGRLESLPPKMEKLVSLRQLYINGCRKLDSLPSGLATLTSLVNLDRLIVHPDTGGLGYLSGLDNLCGVLNIELSPEGWANAIEDAKRSNMSKKHKLDGMRIFWPEGRSWEQGRDEAKAILEALQPHKWLEQLKIYNYCGAMLPGWFCILENLKDLYLSHCNQVEYLEDEIRDNVCFPSLERLTISSMRNLKGWWRQDIPEEANRPCLPKVSIVSLSYCPQLKGPMPLFGAIEELILTDVDMRLVKELLILNPNLKRLVLSIEGLICLPEGWIRHLTALRRLEILSYYGQMWVSRRGLSHLTALEDLRLCQCEIGEEDDDDEQKMEKEVGMPWTALRNLSSLRIMLHVEKCYLAKVGIQYLHSLRDLAIGNCKELYVGWKTLLVDMKLEQLSFWDVESVIDVEDTVVEQPTQLCRLLISARGTKLFHDIPWKSFASLHLSDLSGIGGMEQLPAGIQHLTSLSISCLTCDGLRSVPNWIPQLTSLRSLELYRCPEELKKRCEKERGEDWPLIRHIPSIHIVPRVEKD